MHRLYFSAFVNFENIDTFEVYFSTSFADTSPGPFNCGAISSDENVIFGKADLLKGSYDCLKNSPSF